MRIVAWYLLGIATLSGSANLQILFSATSRDLNGVQEKSKLTLAANPD